MVARVKKLEEGYAVLLSDEIVEELHLTEGSPVQILPAPEQQGPAIRYASVAEVMKVHREMEPFHANAYRELAK